MKYTIREQQCGYLLKDGVLQKLLFAGKHSVAAWRGYELKVVDMMGKVETHKLPVEILMAQPEFKSRVVRVRIPDSCIGLHLVNGIYQEVLLDGDALYWNVFEEHEVRLVDVTGTEMRAEQVPPMYRHLIPTRMYRRMVVGEGELGLLYIDNRFEKQLNAGTYYYWIYAHEVSCKVFNLKLQQLEISGQEILTADKVGIRLNILCSYRITDPLRLSRTVENVGNLLYARLQLLAREQVGRYRLDELLAQKEELGRMLHQQMTELQEEYCVEVQSVGVKDIILPGEIREIMNTVLVAEKKAQANVIMRREEVASTRSLLNTARLMEENQILYRLKELEYLERICDKVGSISLGGGGNVLEQLKGLALPKKEG
ncbi:MAG: slipin family protein [Lachnospiraceae bacterium]|nr:slipin family protein [Lachnospiraceae bacterium]